MRPLDVNLTAIVLLKSPIFLPQPTKPAPSELPAPASRGRQCCRAGLTAPSYSHPWTVYPSTHPHLLLFSGDDSRTSQLSYSTAWAATAVSSPAPCRSLHRPHRRPPPWCSRRGVVNDVHPTAVVLLQPLVFLPQPPKAALVVPHAPASRGRLCCRGGLTVPILLPPLARPSLHSPTPPVILRRRQPHTAAEPVNPRTPLRAGFHCCVFPVSASSPS